MHKAIIGTTCGAALRLRVPVQIVCGNVSLVLRDAETYQLRVSARIVCGNVPVVLRGTYACC